MGYMQMSNHTDKSTISCLCHRGVCGALHYYDVAKKYDASLIYEVGDDLYFLQCSAGDTIEEAQRNWEETIDSFFNRHPEASYE